MSNHTLNFSVPSDRAARGTVINAATRPSTRCADNHKPAIAVVFAPPESLAPPPHRSNTEAFHPALSTYALRAVESVAPTRRAPAGSSRSARRRVQHVWQCSCDRSRLEKYPRRLEMGARLLGQWRSTHSVPVGRLHRVGQRRRESTCSAERHLRGSVRRRQGATSLPREGTPRGCSHPISSWRGGRTLRGSHPVHELMPASDIRRNRSKSIARWSWWSTPPTSLRAFNLTNVPTCGSGPRLWKSFVRMRGGGVQRVRRRPRRSRSRRRTLRRRGVCARPRPTRSTAPGSSTRRRSAT